jgi:hypothetical protein
MDIIYLVEEQYKKIEYFLYCYFHYFITFVKHQMDNFNPKIVHDIMNDAGAYVGKRLFLTEKDDFAPQKTEFVSDSVQSSQSSIVELMSRT